MVDGFWHGAVAGSLACVVSNPFETVKTRLQLQGALNRSPAVYRHGPLSALLQMIRSEGPLVLWRGCEPNIYFNFLLNGLRFGLYERLNTAAGVVPSRDGASFTSYLNATGGGAAAGAVASPFAMMRTRLQARGSSGRAGMLQGFRAVISEAGVAGLLTGAGTQMCRVGFSTGVQLALYDSTGCYLRNRLPREMHRAVPLANCLITGVSTAMLLHPIDVVLVRMYNQPHSQQWYHGVVDAVCKTVRHEGVGGLYKGFGATFLRQVPHTCVTFLVLEHLRTAELARANAAWPTQDDRLYDTA